MAEKAGFHSVLHTVTGNVIEPGSMKREEASLLSIEEDTGSQSSKVGSLYPGPRRRK